jgi:phage tail-like protein
MAAARKDPFQTFNFLIEIEGLVAGGFSECTGLQVETEILDYREGGQNDYIHRFAGPTKYPPLVLKHGLSDSDSLWKWHQQVVRGLIQRRNGTIHLLNARGDRVMLWHFKQAYPYKWTGPELRADSAQVAFETVELAHRGLRAEKKV